MILVPIRPSAGDAKTYVTVVDQKPSAGLDITLSAARDLVPGFESGNIDAASWKKVDKSLCSTVWDGSCVADKPSYGNYCS